MLISYNQQMMADMIQLVLYGAVVGTIFVGYILYKLLKP